MCVETEEKCLPCNQCDFKCLRLIDLNKPRNSKQKESHCKQCEEQFRSTEELSKPEANSHGKKKNKIDNTKPQQCETPVECELIGCCWCKYQSYDEEGLS